MVVEVDVFRAQAVASDEFFVSRWAFVLGIACQHTLQAHAHALHILNRAPALLAQKVKTDDAVRVDMRVYGYRTVGQLDKGHLRRFY